MGNFNCSSFHQEREGKPSIVTKTHAEREKARVINLNGIRERESRDERRILKLVGRTVTYEV